MPRRARAFCHPPLTVLLSLTLPLSLALRAQDAMPDQAVLEATLQRKALVIADEHLLHFYAWRRGLQAEWQGRPVEIFEGTSLRVSFQRHGDECLTAGQFTLAADEVIPVIASLAEGNLRVTSCVPRFPGSTPALYDLRFFGEGEEQELAQPIAMALAAIPSANVPLGSDAPPTAASPSPAQHSAPGKSQIHERPLEDILGRKAEVKDGVALFRLAGPKGLLGLPPVTRMGLAVFAAFAGSDDAARLRLDWTIERRDLNALLRKLGSHGFQLESLVAAAPSIDDELLQLVLVGAGPAADLATFLAGPLDRQRAIALAASQPFSPPTAGREVLGIGGDLAAGWQSGATFPDGPRRAVWQMGGGAEPTLTMTDPGQWSSRTFNLLWNPTIRFRDGKLVLRMRADQGRVDQGGGLIWRAKDENNYYVTRFNPLEQDFRVYHVVDGVRTQTKALGQLPYRSQDWFTIEVEQHGDDIRCVLNGRETLEVCDASFAEAGGVGVWSKADSQCSLAGLWVEGADQPR